MWQGDRTRAGSDLDADLVAAFDRIDHSHILSQLGGFPARDQVAGWLKAGVVENRSAVPDRGGRSPGRVMSSSNIRTPGGSRVSGDQGPVRHCGGFEPPVDVEEHPALARVLRDRFE